MKLAIIGGGPRGLSALESLYAQAAEKNDHAKIYTAIFEETDQLGNGPVYNLEQPDSNWLNVSERGLTIPKRDIITFNNFRIPGFPSYQDWSRYSSNIHKDDEVDQFPLRSKLGKYLRERFNSIATILSAENLLDIKTLKVIKVDYVDRKLLVVAANQTEYTFDEVVMTIGHQPTEVDEQINNWKNAIKTSDGLQLLENPYPISAVKHAVKEAETVALRGFGLAMIDVVRAIAAKKGSFKLIDEATREMIYRPSSGKPIKIIAFSLDGLPMTPKPLHKKIDESFIPTDEELDVFKNTLQTAIKNEADLEDGKFVLKAIAPIVTKKFLNATDHQLLDEELEDVIIKWLADGDVEHSLIVSKATDTFESIQKYVGMAVGKEQISLDYCAGQVWRHCQPTMYKELSFINLEESVVAALIKRDERLKRYSYGPPTDSLQQLVALINQGTLVLDYVENPTITLTKNGWELKKDDKTTTTQVMVDTVLDSPRLKSVDSPIVNSLIYNSLIQPIHNELAIETHENGIVKLGDEKDQIPLAVLGRLAKGSLIGVDAILECFGVRSKFWAQGVTERMAEYY